MIYHRKLTEMLYRVMGGVTNTKDFGYQHCHSFILLQVSGKNKNKNKTAETQQKPITEQLYDIWFQLQLLFTQTCCQKPTLEPGPLCPRYTVSPCPKAPSLKYKTKKR